jgi:Putative ABC exporter
MDSALWLLLWLRFRAWLRRLFRNAGTPRGALFLAAGFLFFALVVGPNVFFRIWQAEDGGFRTAYVKHTRDVGPLLLFAYCVLTVLVGSADQCVSFTPAEVQFLFPGPFSRRKLLAYKVIGNALLCCVYALFLTAFFFAYAARPLAAYPGLLLTLWFIQFFSMAVSLLISTVGARAFSPWRRLLLVPLVLAVWWGASRLGADAFTHGPGEVIARLRQNEVVQILLTPMGWFVETFTAEHAWPDFVLGAARCLGVDALLLLVVFLLDAQYLEAAAAASERAYARMQRVRSGGAVTAVVATGRPRFSLPSLPHWGGIGPLAWRQLTTAARSMRPVLIFLVIFALLVGGSWLALGAIDQGELRAGGWFIGSTVLGMTVAMLTGLLTFDFRGDIDRIDVLKVLPLPAWRVALGQLLAPTLILSAVQLLVVGMVQALWGGVEPLLAGVAVFALPFNFLSIGLENLMFLWFPARPTPAAPGDFQMMGRQALMMVAKFAALLVVVVPAALAGISAGVLAAWLLDVEPVPPALAVGCMVMTALAAGVVPLVAQAFARFDVARDTPP